MRLSSHGREQSQMIHIVPPPILKALSHIVGNEDSYCSDSYWDVGSLKVLHYQRAIVVAATKV